MNLYVGMTIQKPNPITMEMETYKLISLDKDEYGGIIAEWQKVG